MKAMESLQDLIEEAKLRALWWAVCILFVSYIISLTSRSMWMNIPIAAFALAVVRMLSREVEFRWKVRPAPRRGYLAHLWKKQLAVDDPALSTLPSVAINWTRKIDSPLVEAALDEFIGKVLKDFVVDLWYSPITPDKEAPELIRAIVNDVFGEIAERARDVNLLDLLTRDLVKLIGNHLDVYRRNQSAIGVELLATLSLDARDEKLRRHLFASKELHPALMSPEYEYKVLQQMMGAVLAAVLGPREAQCPLVRCMSRELLTCLVMQPLMNLVNPGYINELIEYIFLTKRDDGELDAGKPSHVASQNEQTTMALAHSKDKQDPGVVISANQRDVANLARNDARAEASSSMASHVNIVSSQTELVPHLPPRTAEWARGLEAARERRTEVLAPENLENLWTRGRNYKTKFDAHDNPGPKKVKPPIKAAGSSNATDHERNLGRETGKEGSLNVKSSKPQLKRSRSSSSITKNDVVICEASTSRITHAMTYGESNYMHLSKPCETNSKSTSELVLNKEQSSYLPKLKCRVVGAYFEKVGSKSFAVYSIAVTSADNETWFVKRRYRNFERLHRHLKDIPNYSLQLPPKRFLSSSIDDYFVHQRCILLDKYLQDLLSIANVAEQHEVWDFLSASSKNYSFGKSTSVMKTLADDAMDDIVRQFRGVNGLIRKVVGSPDGSSLTTRSSGISLNEELQQQNLSYSQREISHSASEDEDHVSGATPGEMGSSSRANGWHSDNELDSRQFPPRVVKRYDSSRRYDSSSSMDSLRNQQSDVKSDTLHEADTVIPSNFWEDLTRVPPEWTPPNVSMPLLDLVDTIFQLKQRGWLRRQVFWMSKQILQLLMEDAIDDWLLRQIHWLRREDVIAQGIKWLQDVLWPEGTFFLKVGNDEDKINEESCQNPRTTGGFRAGNSSPVSFEMQCEAARRASDVKKMILGGAPYTLVNLIGQKQYQRCAKDIYFFLQSTTCLKQLAYSILELLLVSVFPELNDVILDIHKKAFH